MTNAIIYVFSGTGNTMKITHAYADFFDKHGVKCTVYDIKNGYSDSSSPEKYDFVGFAYPIHAFNPPYVMHDFIKSIGKLKIKKNYFILKSSGEPLAINNVSSTYMISKLKRKGFRLTNEYHYVMPYNMIFRHSDEMASKMWDTAYKLSEVDVDEIVSHTPHKLKHIPLGRLISFIFRIEHPAMKVNGKYFKVSDKCIHCNMCVKNCPVHNITVENGKFKFGNNCIMCGRCYFHCPTDAFDIGMLNNWRVNGVYNFNLENKNIDLNMPNFCKKSYAKYFANAAERIKAHEAEKSSDAENK